MSIPRSLVLLSLVAAGALPAQGLRHAAAAADVVVVAHHAGTDDSDERFRVHRLRVTTTLKGDAPAEVLVVELKGVGLHVRPIPGATTRIYCLHDFGGAAAKAGLPPRAAPYFKMNGNLGSHLEVGDPKTDPACALVRTIVAADEGAAPRAAKVELLDLALRGPIGLRTEAVSALTERASLLAALSPIDLSKLMSRAVGETEDIPFKIALAQLCAERRMNGLIDALCLSFDQIEDPRYAKAVGRIARRLHDEGALDVLHPHITKTTAKQTREQLLLALGATSTERALDALLNMRRSGTYLTAVDAALRAHGAPRALEAISRK